MIRPPHSLPVCRQQSPSCVRAASSGLVMTPRRAADMSLASSANWCTPRCNALEQRWMARHG